MGPFSTSDESRDKQDTSGQSRQGSFSCLAGLIVSPGRTGDRCHCVELLPVTSRLNTVNTVPSTFPVTLSTPRLLTTLNKERTPAISSWQIMLQRVRENRLFLGRTTSHARFVVPRRSSTSADIGERMTVSESKE